VSAQARQTLANVWVLLDALSASTANVVKTTVYT